MERIDDSHDGGFGTPAGCEDVDALSLRAAGYGVETGLVVLAEWGIGVFVHHDSDDLICKLHQKSSWSVILLKENVTFGVPKISDGGASRAKMLRFLARFSSERHISTGFRPR